MMVGAFLSGSWVGMNMDGSAAPLIKGMVFWSVSVALVAWMLVQRFGPRPQQGV